MRIRCGSICPTAALWGFLWHGSRASSARRQRDRSMEVGNYPTDGWRFWALLAGIAMIGLLGLVMVLVVRA